MNPKLRIAFIFAIFLNEDFGAFIYFTANRFKEEKKVDASLIDLIDINWDLRLSDY